MERLRLPGSWRARFNLAAAVCAAAAVAGVVGVWASRDSLGAPFRSIYLMWEILGCAGVLLRALAYALELKGALEFVGWEEEERIRKRRLLTVSPAEGPVRGPGGGLGESDDTPVHVKVFTVAAMAAWAVALPAGNHADWDREIRFLFLWAAVVPTAAALFTYLWHEARTAARIVSEASED